MNEADATASPDPKLWGGRFDSALDPKFAQVNKSLPFDHLLARQDLAGSIVWCEALAKAKVLTKNEEQAIIGALQKFAKMSPAELVDRDAEDIHSLIEARLIEEVGDAGRKLHTGRSRNDQVATDLKLWLAERMTALWHGHTALIETLLALADKTAGMPMPGYTHLQRAQPITVGHHVMAYVEMLGRDAERLLDAAERMDTCPLGSAALAGTAFPVDRKAIATALGFESGPTRNSLDAVSDRDHVLEILFACSTTMLHLSRLAEDWIFFCTKECGFATFGDAVSTGSSLMPQKRNPDAMELIRGKTGRVVASLTGIMMVMKGLPMAYDKDLQEDKEMLFDAVQTTLDVLHIAGTATNSIQFDADRCLEAAGDGFLDATDLADLLVAAGVPFRDAHDRVGRAVNRAVEYGVELRDLQESDRKELLPELMDLDLTQELSVDRCLARRDVIGGTAPNQVRAAITGWRKRLKEWTS